MRKYICTLISILFFSFSAQAVLMEKDLESTLAVLHAELKHSYETNREMIDEYSQAVISLHDNLVEYNNICQQLGLMLYSQETDHDFAQVFVCQQVEQLKDRMAEDDKSVNNYVEMLEYVDAELARMESLKLTLQRLDSTGKREECLTYLNVVMNDMQQFHDAIILDKTFHDEIEVKINELAEYSDEAFRTVQTNIFTKGRYDYFNILSNLDYYVGEAQLSIDENYSGLDVEGGVVSDWRGKEVLRTALYLFLVLPAVWLLVLLILFCIPKKFQPKDFKNKRLMLSLLISLVIDFVLLAVGLGIYSGSQMMALSIDLMLGLVYTLVIIFLALYLRTENANKVKTMVIYLPLLLVSCFIILLRMILMPDPLMDLCFPPVMLVITVLQLVLAAYIHKNLSALDRVFSVITSVIMVVSTCVAWAGFNILAMQVIGWWTMLLCYILTVSCISYFVEKYRESVFKWDWLYTLLKSCLIPVLYIISVPMSLVDTMGVFEMEDQLMDFFAMRLTGEATMVNISIYRLIVAVILFFVFKYLLYVVKETYSIFTTKRKNAPKAQGSSALTQNLISIAIWGAYVITVMLILNVPKDGISLVTAGLATGLGFAMKDLIENFVYGMQLMGGRLKVGDVIECDGVNGVVDKISYQSTMIVTFDGCVVAFLNGALFKKNFKNKTRNHSKVRQNVTISVAYGTDLDKACKVAADALTPYIQSEENKDLPISNYRPVAVIVKEMGESGIDLEVRFWTKMEHYTPARSLVLTAVYDAFNKNGISIPFPQVDVHMIKD